MAEIGYAYARIAEEIAARIADGTYPPGSALPNERVMAPDYGVAVGTLRRAIRELRDRGLLVTLPHKGTFVTEG